MREKVAVNFSNFGRQWSRVQPDKAASRAVPESPLTAYTKHSVREMGIERYAPNSTDQTVLDFFCGNSIANRHLFATETWIVTLGRNHSGSPRQSSVSQFAAMAPSVIIETGAPLTVGTK